MSDLTVPNEILRQLGGRRFLAMTGATNLLGDRSSLQMRLPRGAKVQRVTVRLDPSDTYTIEGCDIVKPTARNGYKLDVVKRASRSDVDCDDLREAFEEMTGLRTHL
ncbi:MAG: hypothetical protein E6Q97_16975 [Desulfurellales bacterium]|nr:MAG: hypothetical protein E6Q97_16975 [Desulfurellales bacterium]